jgi:putative membrane protein insertion efficiency factor
VNDLASRFAKFALAFYQIHLGGHFGGVCRFQPSCSCYAHQAFERFPPGRAFRLTLARLLRCHPFGRFGLDPVPETGFFERKSCDE